MTEDFGEQFWDERYRSQGSVWSGNPNPQLVTEASELEPGLALDAGSGEGADAIWLAGRGWRVTAVDLSLVALDRGADRAGELGAGVAARIEWLQRDLVTWTPEAGRYDLVSAQFLHLPQDTREPLFQRLAAAVAPGGSLLVVGHHPSDMQTTIARPRRAELFFTAEQVAALLEAEHWDVMLSESLARAATDPDGREVTVHDAVLHARRRPDPALS